MTQKQDLKTNMQTKLKSHLPLNDDQALIIAQSLTPEEQNESHQPKINHKKREFRAVHYKKSRTVQRNFVSSLKDPIDRRSQLKVDRTHITQRTCDNIKLNTSEFNTDTKPNKFDLILFAIESDAITMNHTTPSSNPKNISVNMEDETKDDVTRFNLLELAL